MMAKLFMFIFASFLISCGSDNDRPDDVLPPKKMQVVLWDMIKADELVSYQIERDTTLDRKGKSIELYNEVLRIHKVSEPEFKRSMTFYQKNPKELKVVLDSLRAVTEPPLPYVPKAKTIK